eukprot:scaffold5374_cov100-Skeletonema_dohrnii-CCMP3373.AAC.6
MAIETLRRGIEKEQKLVVVCVFAGVLGGRLPRPFASVAHAIYFGCSHTQTQAQETRELFPVEMPEAGLKLK